MKRLFFKRPPKILRTLALGILTAEIVSLVAVIIAVFFIYRPRLEKETLASAQATSNALAKQIDITMSSISDYAGLYTASNELESLLDIYQIKKDDDSYEAVCSMLNMIQESGTVGIRGVLLFSEDIIFTSDFMIRKKDREIFDSDWFREIKNGGARSEFSPFYDTTGNGKNDSVVLISKYRHHGHSYILALISTVDSMVENIEELSEGLFSGYALASKTGPVFYTSGETGNAVAELGKHAPEEGFIGHDEEGYYVVSVIPSMKWRILGYMTNRYFNAKFNSYLTVTVIMCLVACVIAVLMAVPIARKLLRPLTSLKDAMDLATAGDLDVTAPVMTNDEVGDLSIYFNNLLQQIKIDRENEKKAEAREYAMKYSLLMSQINTHYIYNTMSTINSLARMGRCEEVVFINSALTRILQNNLRIKDGEIFTTVGEAVAIIKEYWNIERIRPNNHVHFSCEADEGLLKQPMLQNLLQPLVENSLRHGLTDEVSGEMKGEISLRITEKDGDIIVAVSDNGRGMEPEKLEQFEQVGYDTGQDSRHIGLANIKKRLYYVYGDRAGIEIRSDQGTTVYITYPKQNGA
ncbi:MAG: sensor histidine kinase [Oscillospiraceae bacterium]